MQDKPNQHFPDQIMVERKNFHPQTNHVREYNLYYLAYT